MFHVLFMYRGCVVSSSWESEEAFERDHAKWSLSAKLDQPVLAKGVPAHMLPQPGQVMRR
jgi:hypothetical protein